MTKRSTLIKTKYRLVEKVQNLTLQLVLLCAVGAFWEAGGELILGCLCDGKGVVEAKPLCEAGTFFRFGSFLGRIGVILSPSFGQSWVERGHRWSLVGRGWDQAGGTSIVALVAF